MYDRKPVTSLVGKTIARVTHVKSDRFRIKFTDGTGMDVATNEAFDENGMYFENDAEWE